MRQYAEASIKLDQIKIVQDTKCCLKVSAVIVKSGVYKYDDGYALKSPMELLKATRTARYAKLTIQNHPDTLVVMSQDQLYGGIEAPHWDRTKMRAVLNFDKDVTPKSFLKRVREAATGGKPLNDSIGFYYRPDRTPGIGPDVNTGKMIHYDYVMRGILIDHVAVGDFLGRCRAPQCGIGIGIDGVLRRYNIETDKVEKRGDKWCVIHCHGPDIGKPLKGGCFDTKEEAEAMHRAIEARKHKGSADFFLDIDKFVDVSKLDDETYQLFFGAANGRPPKIWMHNCMSKAKSFADSAGAFCNWLWNEGPDALKRSMGGSSVQTYGGKKLSETETSQEEKSQEAYDQCLVDKKEQGMTEAEAEEACESLKPTAEAQEGEGEKPTLTPWQQCIKTEMGKEGTTMTEAIAACKKKGIVQTDQEQSEEEVYRACVKGKIEVEGMSPEEAAEACKPKIDQGEVEEPAEPQETLPTPLEQCKATYMEAHGASEAEAEAWCKDELAGLHEPAEKIVEDIMSLEATEKRLNRRK